MDIVETGFLTNQSIRGLDVPRHFLRFSRGCDNVAIEVLHPTPQVMKEIIERLRTARHNYLRKRPVKEIVKILAKVGTEWTDPEYQFRRLADKYLPVISGLSEAAVAASLTQFFSQCTVENLQALLKEELGDPSFLDCFRPLDHFEGAAKAFGPSVISHILAVSSPVLSAAALMRPWLCKSATLAKLSSAEPLFAALFARSVAQVDQEMGETIQLLWWRGGDHDLEKAMAEQSDAIVVFGDQSTVRSIRDLTPPGKHILLNGQSLGVAVVARQDLRGPGFEDAAQRLAFDIAIADQLTCIAPQIAYVEEDGPCSPRDFAAALTDALGRIEARLPRGDIPMIAKIELARFQHVYEFTSVEDSSDVSALVSQPTDPWIVTFDSDTEIRPGPGYRTVRVCPISDKTDVADLIEIVKPAVSTVGLSSRLEDLEDFADVLGEAGVSRVCRLGDMHNPRLLWRGGGALSISNLLRWTELEIG